MTLKYQRLQMSKGSKVLFGMGHQKKPFDVLRGIFTSITMLIMFSGI